MDFVGQICVSDFNPQASEYRLHVDTFAVHATVEVVLQIFRKCVSLLPGRIDGVAYRLGTAPGRHCLGVTLRGSQPEQGFGKHHDIRFGHIRRHGAEHQGSVAGPFHH